MAEKIVITSEDLRDPRIDEVLERERAIREVASRAQPVGGLRRFFFSSMFYLAIVGGLGGFLGWAALEPYVDDGVPISGKISRIEPDHTLTACRRCEVLYESDQHSAGDPCERCKTPVVESPFRGAFRLERTTVLVAPGQTRWKRDGKKVRLGDVNDLKVGDRVFVLGQGMEGDAAEIIAMEIRPLPAGEVGPGEPDLARKARTDRYAGLFWFALIGGLIALGIGSVEGLLSLNVGQAIKSGLIGMAIGFGGGLAGIVPAGLLYGVVGDLTEKLAEGQGGFLSSEDLHGWALLSQIVSRSLAWGVVGMALALGRGVAMKSRRLIFNGLIGGCLGGLFGGMLFDPIGKVAAADTGDLSRAVGFTTIGLLVGLCLGLVEQLSKEAWLLMRTGPLQGKQFVVHRSPTTIGSLGHNDIFLFKDARVQPEHAKLHRVGRAYEIEDLDTPEGTLVNGVRVERRILRDGDTITIGSTELEYRSRGS